MKYAGWIVIWGFLAQPATAHHSLAGFDLSQSIEIEGALVSIKWRNPHLEFTVRVHDEGRVDQDWKIAGWGSAYSMRRTGVSRDDFNIGDHVRVAGHLSTQRENELLVSHMLLSNGLEAIIRPDAEPRWSEEIKGGRTNWKAEESQVDDAKGENRGIFRTWSTSGYFNALSTSTIHTPFRESAVAARASWDPLDNYVMRCEQPGMPQIMIQPHPYQFVDNGSEILLKGEVWGISRTIHMNPDAERGAIEFPHFGLSIGRWDGRTLIVETTEIDWPYFDTSGTPQSDAVAVREEFTLSEDQQRLDYRQVVTDPGTFTEPATLETHWLALGEEIIPWECQPE